MNKSFFKEIETAWGIVLVIFNEKKLLQIFLPIRLRQYKILKGYAKSKKSPAWLGSIEQKIIDYYDKKRVQFNLTRLDMTGYTDFQKKVYKALSRIKYGKTISYQNLAHRSGNPKAFRAVGGIMAKNKFPLIIPCHRVIKANGDTGGFGYGKDYKRQMLKLEKII